MKWYRNPKGASAIGFLILISLIWFVGPYIGLERLESRFGWFFAVMLIWVMTLLVGGVVERRAGGMCEKSYGVKRMMP